jgi:hypothetical protein
MEVLQTFTFVSCASGCRVAMVRLKALRLRTDIRRRLVTARRRRVTVPATKGWSVAMPTRCVDLKEVAMRCVLRPLLLAAVALGVAAPAASAVPVRQLDTDLGALWTKVLETPSAQNSFGTGGATFGCWTLDGTVAPLGPNGIPSCTVKPGTKIFVAASTFECSTFPGDTPGAPASETDLRNCARQNDAKDAPTLTVDGKPVLVTEAETQLLHIVLPEDNIFGQPAGSKGTSVAHGWVALLHPLTPGTHTLVSPLFTTTINVTPGT